MCREFSPFNQSYIPVLSISIKSYSKNGIVGGVVNSDANVIGLFNTVLRLQLYPYASISGITRPATDKPGITFGFDGGICFKFGRKHLKHFRIIASLLIGAKFYYDDGKTISIGAGGDITLAWRFKNNKGFSLGCKAFYNIANFDFKNPYRSYTPCISYAMTF